MQPIKRRCARATCADRCGSRGAFGAAIGRSRNRPSTRSPSIARRCRTAIRPSCGKRAARRCGTSRAARASVSFASCDLGLGPGVVKGAYAQLPRYFADAKSRDGSRDASRLVHGQPAGDQRRPMRRRIKFGDGSERRSDLEALAAYVTSQSRGVEMKVALNEPHVRDMYRLGEQMFFYPWRHARFLLRDVPRRGRQAYPAAGSAEPDQDRRCAEGVHDVARLSRVAGRVADVPVAAQRLLPPAALSRARVRSEASIALTAYLAGRANGAPYNGPAIKR